MRSDLYALGATMHHLLSGRPPVPLKFAPVRSLRTDLSQAIEKVLEKALKLQAHERFQTAREMREALERHFPSTEKAVQSNVSPALSPAKAVQVIVTPASPAAPSPEAARTNPKDGAEMILIPAGEFLMGSPAGEGEDDEHHRHKVYPDAYYIYKYEVTNGQFEKFENETGYHAEGEWKKYALSGKESHPVVSVTWNDASAYCRWAGGALPTEAQWEKAARAQTGESIPGGVAPQACSINFRTVG